MHATRQFDSYVATARSVGVPDFYTLTFIVFTGYS